MRWMLLFIGILLLVIGLPSIGAEERAGAHQAMGRDHESAPMTGSIANMTMPVEIPSQPVPAEVPCDTGDCPSATTVVTIGISG